MTTLFLLMVSALLSLAFASAYAQTPVTYTPMEPCTSAPAQQFSPMGDHEALLRQNLIASQDDTVKARGDAIRLQDTSRFHAPDLAQTQGQIKRNLQTQAVNAHIQKLPKQASVKLSRPI
jgi:hypothetical protein